MCVHTKEASLWPSMSAIQLFYGLYYAQYPSSKYGTLPTVWLGLLMVHWLPVLVLCASRFIHVESHGCPVTMQNLVCHLPLGWFWTGISHLVCVLFVVSNITIWHHNWKITQWLNKYEIDFRLVFAVVIFLKRSVLTSLIRIQPSLFNPNIHIIIIIVQH